MRRAGTRANRRVAEERRRREVLRSLLDRLSHFRDELQREALTPAVTMTEIVMLTVAQALDREPRVAMLRAGSPLH